MWSGTYRHDGIDGWFSCETKAITVKAEFGADEPALITVPYTAIARHSAALPDHIRRELNHARDEMHAVSVAWLNNLRPHDDRAAEDHAVRHQAAERRLRATVAVAVPLGSHTVQLDLFVMPS